MRKSRYSEAQIDRLRKDLDAATGRVAALREEIERHELVHEMLDGRKTGKGTQRSRPGAGALKRGPRGAMIDWRGVFATPPDQFNLDVLDKHGGDSSGSLQRSYAQTSCPTVPGRGRAFSLPRLSCARPVNTVLRLRIADFELTRIRATTDGPRLGNRSPNQEAPPSNR